jgi:aerobic carbon-monoxide dehydrogenase small subunit
MRERSVAVTVNGRDRRVTIPDHRLLREFVREDLALTGTKAACDDGMCGACAVHLDGRVVKSCLVLAVEADGRSITTVEGMADGDALHPIQAALAENFGVQCGFCTPGFVMTIAALLEETPAPEVEELRHELAGNICRCTGYVRIVQAALDAADRMRPTA